MIKEKLITTHDAAELLGFSHDHIRRLCREGKIKAEKLGNNWLLTEKSLKNIKRMRVEKKEL